MSNLLKLLFCTVGLATIAMPTYAKDQYTKKRLNQARRYCEENREALEFLTQFEKIINNSDISMESDGNGYEGYGYSLRRFIVGQVDPLVLAEIKEYEHEDWDGRNHHHDLYFVLYLDNKFLAIDLNLANKGATYSLNPEVCGVMEKE